MLYLVSVSSKEGTYMKVKKSLLILAILTALCLAAGCGDKKKTGENKNIRKIETNKAIQNFSFNPTNNKNAKHFLKIPAPHCCGQVVHPDILYFKNGFHGYKYYLAYTPYPFSNDDYENPCLAVSNDGINFIKTANMKNPIVTAPPDVKQGGHQSDTDIMFYNNELVIHYVYNKVNVWGPAKFYRIASNDGIHWSKPQLIFMGDKDKSCVSPAFIPQGKIIKMWYVRNEGNLAFTESNNDEKSWSTPEYCIADMGNWKIWHIDVINSRNMYEGLFCARFGRSKIRALFYARSTNGIDWSVSKKPILYPSKAGWDDAEIYRSTFVDDNGTYKIWYSARSKANTWHIGYTKFTQSEINASL